MKPKRYKSLVDKSVLIVEDDPSMLERIIFNLEEQGCMVIGASDVFSAEKAISEASQPFDIMLIDMYIPETPDSRTDRVMRGEQLAYTARKRSPDTVIIGMSINLETKPHTYVKDLFSGFIYKANLPHNDSPILLYETIDGIISAPRKRKPKVFIVHGHDSHILLELKDYIQNTLSLGEPVVLRDRPSLGRTIIEKFETESRNVDLVFVIMTPDDVDAQDNTIRRSRQNVIFEAGFFYAKLQRTTGRVILLRKDKVELPSDISGMICIDVSDGIKAASEKIREELKELGWC